MFFTENLYYGIATGTLEFTLVHITHLFINDKRDKTIR